MPRLTLCCNTKCKRAKVCMRYMLTGNALIDVWVEFKSTRRFEKTYCKHFIHVNSKDAEDYIKVAYKGISGGEYES